MMIVTQQRLVSGSVSAQVKSQYVFVTLVSVTTLLPGHRFRHCIFMYVCNFHGMCIKKALSCHLATAGASRPGDQEGHCLLFFPNRQTFRNVASLENFLIFAVSKDIRFEFYRKIFEHVALLLWYHDASE